MRSSSLNKGLHIMTHSKPQTTYNDPTERADVAVRPSLKVMPSLFAFASGVNFAMGIVMSVEGNPMGYVSLIACVLLAGMSWLKMYER
jgi:hypothetical protein